MVTLIDTWENRIRCAVLGLIVAVVGAVAIYLGASWEVGLSVVALGGGFTLWSFIHETRSFPLLCDDCRTGNHQKCSGRDVVRCSCPCDFAAAVRRRRFFSRWLLFRI